MTWANGQQSAVRQRNGSMTSTQTRRQVRLTQSATVAVSEKQRKRRTATAVPAAGPGLSALRHRRRKPHKSDNSSVETIIASSQSSEKSDDSEPEPKPAWELFSLHIARVNTSVQHGTDGEVSKFGGDKQSYVDKCSEVHKRIVKDLRDIAAKKKARELLMKAKLQSVQQLSEVPQEAECDESESEDEEEYERQKRKAEAQRYWAMIRNNVQEKIRLRKLEKGPAGGTWNALRAQLRAMTRGDSVRRDLYEKYGVIPEPGRKLPVDSMRPRMSAEISDIIRKFESIQVRKMSFSAPPTRTRQERTTPNRFRP